MPPDEQIPLILPAPSVEDVQTASATQAADCLYAQVLVQVGTRELDRRTFTYAVPEALAAGVAVGMPVVVPFGRQPTMTGYVVGFQQQVDSGIRIREIVDVLDDQPLFDLEALSLWDWVAQYDATPLHQVIACALPGNLTAKIRREVHMAPETQGALAGRLNRQALPADAQRILQFLTGKDRGFSPRYIAQKARVPLKVASRIIAKLKQQGWLTVQTRVDGIAAPKTEMWLTLPQEPPPVEGPNAEDPRPLTARQQHVVDYLQQAEGGAVVKSTAMQALGVSASVITTLCRRGVVVTEKRRVAFPASSGSRSKKTTEPFALTPDQQAVFNTVMAQAFQLPGAADTPPWVLHGVTGSGKTAVYMALTEAMLNSSRSVLVLVPEIALTSEIARRFVTHFGPTQTAIWHSGLSDAERADTWRRLVAGDIRLLIGARSAVLTPLPNLGLIVMDEAHEGSFKQDSPAPRYHAVTVARERARRTGASLLLGSATPDISHYTEARENGRLLTLTHRFGGRSLASVEVVDMRQERRAAMAPPPPPIEVPLDGSDALEPPPPPLPTKRPSVLSEALATALREVCAAGEQALILINRRGFHTLVQCNDCGHVFHCPQCDVSLTVHRDRQETRCHHCGYVGGLPEYCPHCIGKRIVQMGTGTQRVETALAEWLPTARILRLDTDILRHRDQSRAVIDTFSRGEADVLVGTQMIAKGLDIPNVTLVGVINADSAFYLPDYRSAERGFQLLTQVAGRAGRGDKPGRVLLQSMDPNHAVIQYARDQDFVAFFEQERLTRENLQFPPYSQLFRLIVSGQDEAEVQRYAEAMAQHLKPVLAQAASAQNAEEAVRLLGPAPCVVSRIQGRYRYHCLIKNQAGADQPAVHRAITRFYGDLTLPDTLSVLLDVDAMSLL